MFFKITRPGCVFPPQKENEWLLNKRNYRIKVAMHGGAEEQHGTMKNTAKVYKIGITEQ